MSARSALRAALSALALALVPVLALAPASAMAAELKLGDLFSDHAVLQRDRAVTVWGQADPGALIRVRLANEQVFVTADNAGDWRAILPIIPAGGPYRLEASDGKGATVAAEDIRIGDVFLCSGQSNMEFTVDRSLNWPGEVANSANDNLRMVTIPLQSADVPQKYLKSPVSWQVASPEVTAKWSAACYYFARDYIKSNNVPIGLIASSWGGSNIRAWMSATALTSVGGFNDQLALLPVHNTNPALATRKWGELFQTWWKKSGGPGSPWLSGPRDLPTWAGVEDITRNWEDWPGGTYANYNGAKWYGIKVTLTRAQAAGSARLELGRIDQIDVTWVNGKPVGNTSGAGTPRSYDLPKGTLKEGDNTIIINVLDTYGKGGMYGPGPRRLVFSNGASVSLDTGWRHKDVPPAQAFPPQSPWDATGGLTTIANAMISPIEGYGLAGVLWYQGESNTGDSRALYQAELKAWIRDWRTRFTAPQLPFFIVQLSNYGARPTQPVESGWSEVREAQRLTVAEDPFTALIVSLDIGDPQDIHPANKNELGRRLAIAARSLILAGEEAPSGPEVATAVRTETGVDVTFFNVTGDLKAYSGAGPLGFEVCSTTGCQYAQATLSTDPAEKRVTLSAPVTDPVKVRYCWGDSPTCTLYDGSGLPAGPFEVVIKP